MGLDCLLYWDVLQSKYFGVKTTNPVKLVDDLSKGGLCGRDTATSQSVMVVGRHSQEWKESGCQVAFGAELLLGAWDCPFIICLMAHFSSSIFIVNDELFVRDAILKKTLSAFSVPVIAPTSSSLITFTQKQKEMVLAFSTQSGMNLLWSEK